jgi:hypothetical protein
LGFKPPEPPKRKGSMPKAPGSGLWKAIKLEQEEEKKASAKNKRP